MITGLAGACSFMARICDLAYGGWVTWQVDHRQAALGDLTFPLYPFEGLFPLMPTIVASGTICCLQVNNFPWVLQI